MRIPDYNDYCDQHERAQQAALEKLPICADCGEHIQEDHYFLINDEPICPDCLDSNYRKDTEDYFEYVKWSTQTEQLMNRRNSKHHKHWVEDYIE